MHIKWVSSAAAIVSCANTNSIVVVCAAMESFSAFTLVLLVNNCLRIEMLLNLLHHSHDHLT